MPKNLPGNCSMMPHAGIPDRRKSPVVGLLPLLWFFGLLLSALFLYLSGLPLGKSKYIAPFYPPPTYSRECQEPRPKKKPPIIPKYVIAVIITMMIGSKIIGFWSKSCGELAFRSSFLFLDFLVT